MDDYWEMLTEDQIDFGELPITTLKKLVYSADPFIANGALTELVARDKTEALSAAVDILFNHLPDKYLQAQAFNITYYYNKERALEYIVKNAATCDMVVLNAIVQELCIDAKYIAAHNPMEYVDAVKNRLLKITAAEYPEPKLLKEFFKLFGG